MDTITKIIIGVIIAICLVCALLSWCIGHSLTLALVFTGIATSGMTALAGISYGARLSSAVEAPAISAPAPPTV